MTPAQIQLLRRSFGQLLPKADATAAEFYANLFAADPALRALFPPDLEAQRAKLMQMIGGAVGLVDKPHVLLPMVRQLGERHAAYGVLPAHYGSVGTALLKTLAQRLGPAFDDDTRTAWEMLFALIAGMMLEGAMRDAA
jgi:hemoglobin-like flavoprotein